MIKVISFDFYGVLYSNFDWGAINDRIYVDSDLYRQFRGMVDDANSGKISNHEFRAGVMRLADDDNYPSSRAVLAEPIVNMALLKFIDELRAKQSIKLAILSNGSHSHVDEVLEVQGVLKYFDLVATSAELPNYKPEKAAFDFVVNYFGIENRELLHIDDSPRHIAGAKDAGVQAILYSDLKSLRQELDRVITSD